MHQGLACPFSSEGSKARLSLRSKKAWRWQSDTHRNALAKGRGSTQGQLQGKHVPPNHSGTSQWWRATERLEQKEGGGGQAQTSPIPGPGVRTLPTFSFPCLNLAVISMLLFCSKLSFNLPTNPTNLTFKRNPSNSHRLHYLFFVVPQSCSPTQLD